MRVIDLVQNALVVAKKTAPIDAPTVQKLHTGRAVAWINALADQFQTRYKADAFRVFSKYNKTNRDDFGLNELLFDVSVCEVERSASVTGRHELWYAKRAVWQVESEFAKNSRAALIDFSKLVLGGASNKLFVAPITGNCSAFRDALLPAANCCGGAVFVACVPHPEDFSSDLRSEVHVLDRGAWRPCDNEVV